MRRRGLLLTLVAVCAFAIAWTVGRQVTDTFTLLGAAAAIALLVLTILGAFEAVDR